jgi:hypothetical protein
MIKHHLTHSRLYILTNQNENISQEDFDNVYITYIGHDLTKVLTHLESDTKTETYMPLLKMNR